MEAKRKAEQAKVAAERAEQDEADFARWARDRETWLERCGPPHRLEADARKVPESASGSGAAEPKVFSFVAVSAEGVREAACARGVLRVGVEYAIEGQPGAYTLTESVGMDM